MIEAYLNQRMTVRRRTGVAFNGDPTFQDVLDVPCRWEKSRRLVRNEQGEQVVSETTVFTQEAVSTGDELVDSAGRTWPVVTVGDNPGLDGESMFLEVAL